MYFLVSPSSVGFLQALTCERCLSDQITAADEKPNKLTNYGLFAAFLLYPRRRSNIFTDNVAKVRVKLPNALSKSLLIYLDV
jgi:hypothetical protein